MFRKRNKLKNIGIYAILSLVSFIVAFPVLWMLSVSFRPHIETFSIPAKLFPKTFILDAYTNILSNPERLRFFFNSYFVGIMVTIISVAIGSLAGYGFSRFDFRGNRVMGIFI